MRPMGNKPPRDTENDRLKAAIYAERCNQINKARTPASTTNDQLGAAPHETPERGYFDCCMCGEPYNLESGESILPLIHDRKNDTYWCEACFREYAETALKAKEATP